MFTEWLLRRVLRRHGDPAAQRAACGKLTGTVGIFCNLVLFAAKLAIGLLAGSVSIMADAVNNLSDASSSIVMLLGFRMAARPADAEHPFGHARMEYFSGLFVAVLILAVALELGKSAIEKILHPSAVAFSAALAAVLALSIAVKLWLSFFYRRAARKIDSTALQAAAADSRNDVIATAAVLASCLIDRLSGVKIDGVMALAVSVFIFLSGLSMVRDTINPLLGAAPDPELTKKIRALLLREPLVLGIHDLMIHDYGPGRQFASVHAEMDEKKDAVAAHEALDALERACRKECGVQLTIHYDPISTDDAALNAMHVKLDGILAGIDPRLSIHDFRMVQGAKQTNLIFDLVVPFDLQPRCAALKQEIDRALEREPGMRYYTVISFDEDAFNQREE